MSSQSIVMDSPIGKLEIHADHTHLTTIQFVGNEIETSRKTNHPILIKARDQISQFFKGERKEFELPLRIEGTTFQREVWHTLQKIPYGKTWSYQEMAETIKRPKAVRAVGQANKANPFPIIIPCHRVIGKDQSLTGYAGKHIDKKEMLLMLEK
ncbi:methylated-DNA--[protein]-cysteine S-methyltransferase [Bacillus sp. RO3]|nr:methylated-DNA--[protein]-cysteine S-methyltransferase [Bacillus sp. RO3]